MGFAVFHPEKGSGTGGGIGHHIDRTPGHEHTYPHIDPSRGSENINYPLKNGMHELSLPEGISKRIEEGYTGKKSIRKDAVKFLSMVFTGTHEDMIQLAANPQKFKEWQKANYQFICKEFGRDNILRFSLHMDEKTPHIHAIVVPLTPDGRLSAKEIMGNKKNLSERQDRYAIQMEPFGLSRGVVGSKARHTGEGWYIAQLKEAAESPNKASVPTLTLKDRFMPANYESAVKSTVNALQNEVFDTKLENRRRADQVKSAQEAKTRVENEAVFHKQAVQDIARQFIQSGKEGLNLNSSFALLEAPKAIQAAAHEIFRDEVNKFAQVRLKPIAQGKYNAFHNLHERKFSKEEYKVFQKQDNPESHQKIATASNDLFNHEVENKWGVKLSPGSRFFEELKEKAIRLVKDISQITHQHIRTKLGLDPPQKRRGMSL